MQGWQSLKATDGTNIPFKEFGVTETSETVLILWPALGVRARFYESLCEKLACLGVTVVLAEQRGHGCSPYRPGRGEKFNFRDYVTTDMVCLLDHIRGKYPSASLLMGGHSLGGHLSSVFSALFPEKIDGIVHIACSFPFKGAYPGRTGRQIGLLCNLIPLFGLFWGYYPGKLVGFGGNEYLGVMQDWRMWARSGCFDTADLKGINQKMSDFTGQVLSIRMDQDDYAMGQGLELAVSGFTAAKVHRVQLSEEHQGKYLGHFNWAKKPKGVAQSISDWISKIGEEQG